MKETPNDLVNYIEKLIDKHYSLNDKGHDKQHVEYVINRGLKFAKQLENINLNMVYVVAAYHDVAHHIDAKKHEELSAQMLLEDKKLKEFFNEDEIKIMSDAVADHRSSLEGDPRTIYGKIVSSADRNTNVNVTLKRCYSYNKKHSPELSENELIEKCRKFLLEKFGVNGYARDKMYFYDEDYTNYLNDITELASNIERFKKEIKKVNQEITDIVKEVKEELLKRNKNTHEKDGYNFWDDHIKFVFDHATELAIKYNADIEIVQLAALLHDISMVSYIGPREEHHIYGAKIAEELLLERNYPIEKIDRVKKCILNHRGIINSSRNTIEEKIIADADVLAHFDAIPSLFSLAFNELGLNLHEGTEFVKDKLKRDYNKLSLETRIEMKIEYEKTMNVLFK